MNEWYSLLKSAETVFIDFSVKPKFERIELKRRGSRWGRLTKKTSAKKHRPSRWPEGRHLKKIKTFWNFHLFLSSYGQRNIDWIVLVAFFGVGGPFYFPPKDLRGNMEELAKEGILNTLRPPLDNVDYLFPLPLDHNHSPTKHLLTWRRYACKANT